MVPTSPAGDGSQASVSVQSYPAWQPARRPQVTSDDDGGWSTVGKYMLVGIAAASIARTLVRGSRPRDLFDDAVLALDTIVDSRVALADTRYNLQVMTFFAPVVAAAGVVLAVQVGRLVAAFNK